MKRLAYTLVLVLLTGGAWNGFDNFRIKHPVSGREVTVDDHLYILETHGGRAVARLKVGNHPLSARLSKDGTPGSVRLRPSGTFFSS